MIHPIHKPVQKHDIQLVIFLSVSITSPASPRPYPSPTHGHKAHQYPLYYDWR